MTATKTKKTGTKGETQDTLLEPQGEYRQGAVDGSGTIRQTAPKHIQDAANDWFKCKAKENLAKNNSKKSFDFLLEQMEKAEITNVLVYNAEEKRKDRLQIVSGEDRIKVEKGVIG